MKPSLQPVLDPAKAVRALKRADPQLARVIALAGPCTLAPTEHPPFRALFRSIVFQQLSTKAASTILGRVVALYPGDFPTPAAVLATADETLRAAGLSANKVRSVKDLSEKALAGIVPSREALAGLPDAEVIQHCTQVRGVGQWTVEMMLMFHLGRPDVLPVDDLGIQKGAQRVYGLRKLPSAERLTKLAAPWRPWRSVGSWYLWRALELPEGALGAAVRPPRPR
ncbi:DNA-3-methyladenine glycosylase 2 family protein [Aggregicoccus sp. 17bor-14]|uniref:DNA-3-methyladenine glycosylase family protein n=1 Tax=Myxococcaceae TaxID=31 RepID=UPI00129C672A|nr:MULTISPECIES: DNA-3-methyladenine glycosylase [Myxococcaceae]MBF5042434.1 DNA-3-methyladenine glycosylase 2 family protein [Simulacricoccus sp. 17bor-14]MRI88205.1 DNA-3-methyladenine glycosylase 2 family protein [Aggregicoccus sp. 17bor-14]